MPYRDPPDNEVELLRETVREALRRTTERLDALPPSKLERLTELLARLDGVDVEHPAQILAEIGLLANRPLIGDDLYCSPKIDVAEGKATAHVVGPEWLFYGASLRVDAPPLVRGDFQIVLNDRIVVERCPFGEFRQMTPVNMGCFGREHPINITVWGNNYGRVRFIFRGEDSRRRPIYPPGHPYPHGLSPTNPR